MSIIKRVEYNEDNENVMRSDAMVKIIDWKKVVNFYLLLWKFDTLFQLSQQVIKWNWKTILKLKEKLKGFKRIK